MGDLQCRCGNLLESGGQARRGHYLVNMAVAGKIETAGDGKLNASELLNQLVTSDELYECDNCGCLTLERGSADGDQFLVFQRIDPVPTVNVDLESVDALGRAVIEGGESHSDVRAQKLILKAGLAVRARSAEGSYLGTVEASVDANGTLRRDEWVIQPDVN